MPDHLALQSIFKHAVEAMDRGEHEKASDLCNEMLGQHRNDLNAISLLAKIARAQRQYERGIDLCRKLLKAQPKDPEFRSILGQIYVDAGRYSQGLVQFDRALKTDPRFPTAIAGKAEAYERQDRYDRASRLIEPIAKEGPLDAEIAHVYVRILNHEKKYERAIEIGLGSVEAAPAADMPVRNTLFGLSRAYELNGEYAQSFDAARRANEMMAVPFDVAETRRQVDVLKEYFTPELFAKTPRPRSSSDVPIFIAAVPRSGTTLVERIIQSHPSAYGAGETPLLQEIVNTFSARIGSDLPFPRAIDDLEQEDVDALSKAYLEPLTALAPRAQRITDKQLGNAFRLGLIKILFPNARVIHCRRNPIDTCLSCYLGRLEPTMVPFAGDLDHLGRYWNEHERLMRFWTESLDFPILEVEYEALVDDQRGMTERIIDFCGLPWDDACLRPHEAKRQEKTLSYDQVSKPIYKTSVGRAERYGALLDPLRKALEDELG